MKTWTTGSYSDQRVKIVKTARKRELQEIGIGDFFNDLQRGFPNWSSDRPKLKISQRDPVPPGISTPSLMVWTMTRDILRKKLAVKDIILSTGNKMIEAKNFKKFVKAQPRRRQLSIISLGMPTSEQPKINSSSLKSPPNPASATVADMNPKKFRSNLFNKIA